MTFVLASRNRKKIAEMEALLRRDLDPDVTILSLDQAGITGEIEETGKTFEENALCKASVPAARGYVGIADQ